MVKGTKEHPIEHLESAVGLFHESTRDVEKKPNSVKGGGPLKKELGRLKGEPSICHFQRRPVRFFTATLVT